MNPPRIIGAVLLVAGVILFIVGLNASDSVSDQVSNFFTGTFTDRTMWYLIGGGVMAAVGLVMVMTGGRWGRG